MSQREGEAYEVCQTYALTERQWGTYEDLHLGEHAVGSDELVGDAHALARVGLFAIWWPGECARARVGCTRKETLTRARRAVCDVHAHDEAETQSIRWEPSWSQVQVVMTDRGRSKRT